MLSSMSSVLERERAELRRMAEERFAELEIAAKPQEVYCSSCEWIYRCSRHTVNGASTALGVVIVDSMGHSRKKLIFLCVNILQFVNRILAPVTT